MRTEIRSKHTDFHVSHVFTDGTDPESLRYDIKSAALQFIPAEDLEKKLRKVYKICSLRAKFHLGHL
ncbi:peptide-methionine (R)-S-oxide reductase [Jeotgalibacillus marinus]|uniref:peptide-methionine (R)-S-oxide reductase n=1 Tax=Jeotgalibacillus marinus TaxID=86667 RepID=UPI003F5C7C17